MSRGLIQTTLPQTLGTFSLVHVYVMEFFQLMCKFVVRWRLDSNVCALDCSGNPVLSKSSMKTALGDLKQLSSSWAKKILLVPKNLFPSDSAKADIVIGYGLHHFAPDFICSE